MSCRHYTFLMKTGTTVLLLAISTLLGCASSPVTAKDGPRETVRADSFKLPRIQTHAIEPTPQQPMPKVGVTQNAVYRPAQIAQVEFDAYVDEQGRLHRPNSAYVIVSEGGWNVDAVRRPGAYIPPDNAITPQNLPGVHFGKSSTLPPRKAPPSSLFDPRDMDVTGYMSLGDEAKARAKAGPGETAIYDPQLGWLLVPQAVFHSMVDTPSDFATPRTESETNVSNGQVRMPSRSSTIPSEEPRSQSPAPEPENQQSPPEDLFEEL